jgi:hypothetical protein
MNKKKTNYEFYSIKDLLIIFLFYFIFFLLIVNNFPFNVEWEVNAIIRMFARSFISLYKGNGCVQPILSWVVNSISYTLSTYLLFLVEHTYHIHKIHKNLILLKLSYFAKLHI